MRHGGLVGFGFACADGLIQSWCGAAGGRAGRQGLPTAAEQANSPAAAAGGQAAPFTNAGSSTAPDGSAARSSSRLPATWHFGCKVEGGGVSASQAVGGRPAGRRCHARRRLRCPCQPAGSTQAASTSPAVPPRLPWTAVHVARQRPQLPPEAAPACLPPPCRPGPQQP